MRIIVVSSDYPGPDLIYGDQFVHARVKRYKKYCDAKVFGYNAGLTTDRVFEYEGVSAYITSNIELFKTKVNEFDPDLIACHFVQQDLIETLLSIKKPIAVFVHGYEALSWKRRLMNYRAPGDLRYLLAYYKMNVKQLREMKKLGQRSNQTDSIHFVFISNWLKQAVESDWNMALKNSHVIPNGIDTELFRFNDKRPELRKKILLLRSFKAWNYANDIAIDTILLLSKKEFFNDLEFTIYGEGFLFARLTKKVSHFSNVTLNNFFVENKTIPAIHEQHGLFLCPTRLDTQGVSMCEAMASGLIPLTSPIGGIPEYASDTISSFQFNSAEEIAGKIEYLYNNPDVFLKMSRAARKEVEDKIDLSVTTSKELDLFKKVTGKTESVYRQCLRCILDTNDDPEIIFDDKGICSYCRAYNLVEAKFVKSGKEGEEALTRIVNEIKTAGAGKPYDCILGISGGVDSTYLALMAKDLGLRPLAVHFDNGWNSELAVHNIERIITKLDFHLHTFVIDWEEFRDLQLAFLKASIVDIEMITDHAIITKLYQLAIENNIKYILSGTNVVTEAILPRSWVHDKRDHVHIRAINKQFGTIPLRTFPLFTSKLKWQVEWKGIKSVSLLDLLPYNKEQVKRRIETELGWRDYGGKHYESIFTRFYQGYILPNKFNIDKRRAHYSNLICSGQLSREEALEKIKNPQYERSVLNSDYEFVLKKLGLTEEEFHKIMTAPIKKHTDYPIERSIYSRFPVLTMVRPFWRKLKRARA
jgi:N-acetyl sugar amidotransferase